MSEYKSTCGHIEKVAEAWPHPIDVANLTVLAGEDAGKHREQFVLRLHKLSNEGLVSNADSKRSWVSIQFCPWCGAELPRAEAK